MTKEKKRSKRKGLKVFLIILCCLAAIIACWLLINGHTPNANWYGNGSEWSESDDFATYYENMPTLVFRDADGDGKLKILHLADPQMKFGYMTKDTQTMDLIKLAVTTQKPDFVAVTGDLTLSIFAKSAVIHFAEFMEKQQVYWGLVYGNHDSEFTFSKYQHSNLLSKYKYCLFDGGPSNVKGESNYFVKVVDEGGALKYAMCMLDSNMYPEERTSTFSWEYDELHQTQVDWYSWNMANLLQINPQLKSSAFMHIPLAEYQSVFDSGNFVGVIGESDKKDDNGNSIGAGIYYQGGSGGQAFYDAMVRLGSTNAVFCGHDHINTMRGLTDDNVLLAYGRCCGYHTYPFFETQKNTLMEKLMHSIFGNEGAAMYLDQWVDEDGNVIGKGVSIIEVDLTQDNYGSLRMYDISHKSLQEGTFVVENEITIGG